MLRLSDIGGSLDRWRPIFQAVLDRLDQAFAINGLLENPHRAARRHLLGIFSGIRAGDEEHRRTGGFHPAHPAKETETVPLDTSAVSHVGRKIYVEQDY